MHAPQMLLGDSHSVRTVPAKGFACGYGAQCGMAPSMVCDAADFAQHVVCTVRPWGRGSRA